MATTTAPDPDRARRHRQDAARARSWRRPSGRFGGGTWFVDLAPVRDPELLGIIVTTLGLREEPGVPVATTLHEHLRRVDALLVLDNLEQLLPAAATIVAAARASRPGSVSS